MASNGSIFAFCTRTIEKGAQNGELDVRAAFLAVESEDVDEILGEAAHDVLELVARLGHFLLVGERILDRLEHLAVDD